MKSKGHVAGAPRGADPLVENFSGLKRARGGKLNPVTVPRRARRHHKTSPRSEDPGAGLSDDYSFENGPF